MTTLDTQSDPLRPRPVLRRTAIRRSRPHQAIVRRSIGASAQAASRSQSQQRTPRTALLAPLGVMALSGCLLNALATGDSRDALLIPMLGLFAVAAMLIAGWRVALVLTTLLDEPRR